MGKWEIFLFKNWLLIIYFFSSFLTSTIQACNVGWDTGDEIWSGKINNILHKPLNHLLKSLFIVLGKTFFSFVVFSLVGFFFLFFFLEDWFVSVSVLSVLYFLFFYIIGLSAFWLGMMHGLNHAVWVIINFLSGSILPLSLLPQGFQQINNFLPFKYFIWIPVGIITNKIQPTYWMIFIGLFWVLSFFLLARFIFFKV